MMHLLIDHGADASHATNGIEPIFQCFYPEEVRVLLDAGADVNARCRGAEVTPLMSYVGFPGFSAMVDIATYLVKRGADLSFTDDLGQDAETIALTALDRMESCLLYHAENQTLLPSIDLAPAWHLVD